MASEICALCGAADAPLKGAIRRVCIDANACDQRQRAYAAPITLAEPLGSPLTYNPESKAAEYQRAIAWMAKRLELPVPPFGADAPAAIVNAIGGADAPAALVNAIGGEAQDRATTPSPACRRCGIHKAFGATLIQDAIGRKCASYLDCADRRGLPTHRQVQMWALAMGGFLTDEVLYARPELLCVLEGNDRAYPESVGDCPKCGGAMQVLNQLGVCVYEGDCERRADEAGLLPEVGAAAACGNCGATGEPLDDDGDCVDIHACDIRADRKDDVVADTLASTPIEGVGLPTLQDIMFGEPNYGGGGYG